MFRTLHLLLAALSCSVLPASAQTMYRCGNTFQDHPCGGGQVSRAIGTLSSTDTARNPAASPALGAVCAQRGVAAQKIKWMREAGRTEHEQIAAAGDRQELIADVYRRQGTSAQVRSAIEADCMAEQERSAQAAALLAAANRTQAGAAQGNSTGGGRDNDGVPVAPGVASARPGAGASASAAGLRTSTCEGLSRQLDEVRSRQRAGGNLQAVEALRQQYADIEGRRRKAGC
jgi:hypothetical protein